MCDFWKQKAIVSWSTCLESKCSKIACERQPSLIYFFNSRDLNQGGHKTKKHPDVFFFFFFFFD